jgi:starch synthase
MVWALDQALGLYQDRKAWRAVMRRGMGRDFSWERSAREYVTLFERALSKA